MTISFLDQLVHQVDLLHVPPSGRWTLEFAYPGDAIPSGRQTLQWGNAALVGTVDPDHVGAFSGEVRVKLVGGWGWSQTLPASWHQSDSPGIRGRTIATKAAQAVGETLYGSTGQTQPNDNLFRPLRVSYAQAAQTAGSVLQDVLAPGQTWWIDFDGATRTGVRMAPSPVRVALLDYDSGSQWADIDCDDPLNIVGATIPADPIRGTPALVINELFAWTSEEGFRFRCAVAPAKSAEHSRLAEALKNIVRGFVPELPALELRRARVTAQASDGRVSLQQVDRSGEVSDFGRTEGAVRLYAGSPGVSAEFDFRSGATPETILAFSRADWSDPISFLSPAIGEPGHVPFRTFHEAADTIRFVGRSSGIVRVGAAPTVAVALAPAVTSLHSALTAFATALQPVPPAGTTLVQLTAAAIALQTALAAITGIAATRLEAK